MGFNSGFKGLTPYQNISSVIALHTEFTKLPYHYLSFCLTLPEAIRTPIEDASLSPAQDTNPARSVAFLSFYFIISSSFPLYSNVLFLSRKFIFNLKVSL